jgi:hypothetical protein
MVAKTAPTQIWLAGGLKKAANAILRAGANRSRPLSGQRRRQPRAARSKPFTITGYSLADLAAALDLDQRLFYERHRRKVRTVRCPIRDFPRSSSAASLRSGARRPNVKRPGVTSAGPFRRRRSAGLLKDADPEERKLTVRQQGSPPAHRRQGPYGLKAKQRYQPQQPPILLLHEALKLDAKSPSGLTWRARPAAHFPSTQARALWATRFAGRPVQGCASGRGGTLRVGLTLAGRVYRLPVHRAVAALKTGRWPAKRLRLKDRAP